MFKLKMIAIIIVCLFLGTGISSISGSQVLDGQIDVEINGFILGSVHPRINLENESDVTFQADEVTEEDVTYYTVNDSIIINLDIDDNTGKDSYIFSRSVIFGALLIRKPVVNLKVGGFLRRMFAAKPVLKIISVVNATIGANKTTQIEIPVNYTIAKETLEDEDMTLHVMTMGMLPGDINGVEGLHVIDYKKVTLHVDYI